MSKPRKNKNRGLVNRKAINTGVDLKLYNLFIELHRETKVPQSRLLDEALELLLIKRGKLTMEEDHNG